MIQFGEQLADGLVQFLQREELMMALQQLHGNALGGGLPFSVVVQPVVAVLRIPLADPRAQLVLDWYLHSAGRQDEDRFGDAMSASDVAPLNRPSMAAAVAAPKRVNYAEAAFACLPAS